MKLLRRRRVLIGLSVALAYLVLLLSLFIDRTSSLGADTRIELLLLLLAGVPVRLWAMRIIGGEVHDEVVHASLKDDLTGLWSRGYFMSALETASPRASAVLYLDLDNLKLVNDSFGHHAGDQVLAEAAKRFEPFVRRKLTVGRLGGDEFAIFLQGKDLLAAEFLAGSLVRAFQAPFLVEGQEVSVTLSVGVAASEDPGVTFSDLLRRADVALYRAKSEGRNRWRRFDDAAARERSDTEDATSA